MRVLFIVPYPTDEAPSQRFRFEQYYNELRASQATFDVQSFIDHKTWSILYKKGHQLAKVAGIMRGFLRRIILLFRVMRYDYVFIHREAAPLGPPVFEWIIAVMLRKKVIYDFDDAIWMPNVSDSNRFASRLKWYSKVSSICKWSYKVSCGNEFLAAYASKYNQKIVVIPTFVNTDSYKPGINQNEKITIGWTGSLSTNKYLEDIDDILCEVQRATDCHIICISNKPPSLTAKFEFILWDKHKEIVDLQRFDIGIMPLTDDEWSKGKCGFKLIQYLSVGIPAIASPVGVNKEIITNDINGYLCNNRTDWIGRLIELCQNTMRRKEMGKAGRAVIVSRYSKQALREIFFQLFS